MKKLIIKTAIITVSAIIAAILLTYLTFVIFMPGRLAGFYDKLGLERQAVKQMSREYEKTDDLSDLIKLCQYCDKYGDNRLIAQHFSKLFDDEAFLNYTKTLENGSELYDLFAGKFVVALYKTGKDSVFVVDRAFELTHAYVEYNPVHALIVAALERESLDALTLTGIKDRLQILLTTAPAAEIQLINSHYDFLVGVLTE